MKRILLAVAAGIAQFASFPPVGWWWTSLLGVALLVWAVRDTTLKRSALLGLLSGWAFFLPLLHWLSVLGWDAWLALSLVMGLWFALLAVMVNLALGTTWWVLGVPAVWMLQEWARSRFPWGGLGWGRLAFGQPDSPLTGWVSLGGAPLLGFAVALAGCLLLALVASRRGAFIAIGGICALVIVGLVVRPGTTTQESPATSQLAVVQGNVAQPGIDFLGRSLQVLGNHQRATVELAAALRPGSWSTRPRVPLMLRFWWAPSRRCPASRIAWPMSAWCGIPSKARRMPTSSNTLCRSVSFCRCGRCCRASSPASTGSPGTSSPVINLGFSNSDRPGSPT